MNTTYDTIETIIGQSFTSDPFEISQERIVQFADATNDHQWIHIDEERAAEGPFGATVAHGYLTLSLLVPLVQNVGLFPEDVSAVINYGLNKLRFINPVTAGGSITLQGAVTDVTERRDGQKLLTVQCEVVGAGGNTVLATEALFLLVR